MLSTHMRTVAAPGVSHTVETLEARAHTELTPDDLSDLTPLIRQIVARPTPQYGSLALAQRILTEARPTDPDALIGLLSLLLHWTRGQGG